MGPSVYKNYGIRDYTYDTYDILIVHATDFLCTRSLLAITVVIGRFQYCVACSFSFLTKNPILPYTCMLLTRKYYVLMPNSHLKHSVVSTKYCPMSFLVVVIYLANFKLFFFVLTD